MRLYEVVYILDASLEEAAVSTKLEKFHELATARGGEVSAVDHWGARQLAYPIQKQSVGYYVVAQFTAAAEALPEYERLLKDSQFVLSTADQEFQGLAVMEAMALGCIPVVPDQLAYPEYVPDTHRYLDPRGAGDCLNRNVFEDPRDWVAAFAFKNQAVAWRDLVQSTKSDFRPR